MGTVHVLGHNDSPVLPSGEILIYTGGGRWRTNPLLSPTMLKYVFHALIHGSTRLKVGDRLLTPDGRWWYCRGRRTLERIDKWSSSV